MESSECAPATISPELKLVALLTRHQAGATAETLADDLAGAEMVVGSRGAVSPTGGIGPFAKADKEACHLKMIRA